MKKLFLTLIIALLALSICAQDNVKAKTEKDCSEVFKLIEVWMNTQKDFNNLRGITATIVQDQEVIWSGANGMTQFENYRYTKSCE